MKKKDRRDKTESAFEKTARELGTDESGEAFERAFGKIVPPKQPKLRDENPKTKKPRK